MTYTKTKLENNGKIKENKFTRKNDANKIPWNLVDMSLIEGIPSVLLYGIEKYGKRDSWKTIEEPEERYYAALIRHLIAYRKGEAIDPESGLSHLAHILTNIYFLIEFENKRKGK